MILRAKLSMITIGTISKIPIDSDKVLTYSKSKKVFQSTLFINNSANLYDINLYLLNLLKELKIVIFD